MPCEHFQETIVEAAANGTGPQGKLRVHLSVCADCRDAFAAEQMLFRSVDAGLVMKANVAAPSAFLHRVRARLLQEGFLQRTWIVPQRFLVSAALLASAVLLVTIGWHKNVPQGVKEAASNNPPPSTVLSEHGNPSSVNAYAQNVTSSAPNFSGHKGKFAKVEIAGEKQAEIEVLVPQDQEVLLASYAQELRNRHSAPLVAKEIGDAEPGPLQVDLIQIAQLDVKPLAEVQP